jgi:hypothetical protein
MEADLRQKRFVWGTVLAWAPWLPMMIGLGSVFRGMSNSKATGLAALAGGFVETYAWVGLASTVICEMAALVLLFRTFSRGDGVRSAISALSICMSALMILLLCFSLWLFWFASHHTF